MNNYLFPMACFGKLRKGNTTFSDLFPWNHPLTIPKVDQLNLSNVSIPRRTSDKTGLSNQNQTTVNPKKNMDNLE